MNCPETELTKSKNDKKKKNSLSYMLISVPGIYGHFQISPAIFAPKPRGIYCLWIANGEARGDSC